MEVNVNSGSTNTHRALPEKLVVFFILLVYLSFIFYIFFYPNIAKQVAVTQKNETLQKEALNEREFQDIIKKNNLDNVYTTFISNSSEPEAHYFNSEYPDSKAYFSGHNANIDISRRGDIIVWYNKDSVSHKIVIEAPISIPTIKADNGDMKFPIISDDIPPGGMFKVTFTGTGDFKYHDASDINLKGGFLVDEAKK